jgi:hypothetical protein
MLFLKLAALFVLSPTKNVPFLDLLRLIITVIEAVLEWDSWPVRYSERYKRRKSYADEEKKKKNKPEEDIFKDTKADTGEVLDEEGENNKRRQDGGDYSTDSLH